MALADSLAAPPARPSSFKQFWASDGAMLVVIVLWSFNVSFLKGAMSVIPPLPFTALRFGLASLLLALVVRWREGTLQAPRATWWRLVWLGIVGNTVYQYFFSIGLSKTTAANNAMLMGTNPAFVALLGGLIGLERITRRVWGGIALAFAGIAVVMLGRGAQLSTTTLTGDFLTLCAVLCWAIYGLGIRSLAGQLSALQATALTLLTGTPGLILLGLPQARYVNWRALPLQFWLSLAYTVCFGLVVCYVLYHQSARRIGNVRTALYGCTIPPLAALLAWPLLGERPTIWHALSTILVISGVMLARRK